MKEGKKTNVKVDYRCSNCGSKLGYMRLKAGLWVCRICSHEGLPLIEEIEDEDDLLVEKKGEVKH